MRIGLVSAMVSPIHRQVPELAGRLVKDGHDVRIYARRADPAAPAEEELASGAVLEHAPIGPPQQIAEAEAFRHAGHFGQWLAWRWAAGGWAPDVVHAHAWMSGLAAVTGTRPAAIPVVQTFGILGAVRRRYLGSADRIPIERIGLERALWRAVDRVVARSPSERTELTELGVARGAISVIPAGVDTRAFTPHGPRAPNDPRRSRILAVGELGPRSGLADAIAALRLVPEAELVVVGGPPAAELARDRYARQLRSVALRAGIADRVHLVGAVAPDKMPEWYRSATLFVATPACPSFGLAAVEAMACGVPVVGYDIGGVADSVVDDLTGRLVRAGDVNRLAVALRQLLTNRVERLAYAEAAVDRVRARYEWSRVAAELELLYRDVAGVPAGQPE